MTLDGEKSDWEILLARIDRLNTLGPKTNTWASMLRPVLERIIKSFDTFKESSDVTSESEKQELREFWNSIACYYGGGSGPTWLSGWITVFCPFNSEGEWIDLTCAPGTSPPPIREDAIGKDISRFSQSCHPKSLREAGVALVLDGQYFPIIDSRKVPSGFVELDLLVNDDFTYLDSVMVAGQLGGKILDLKGDIGEGNLFEGKEDKLGIASGWFLFVKDGDKM